MKKMSFKAKQLRVTVAAASLFLATANPVFADVTALGEAAIQQIVALQNEKASRTPAQLKMDSQLVYAIKQSRGQSIAPGVNNLTVRATVSNGRALVDIVTLSHSSAENAVVQAGGEVVFSSARFSSIRAWLPMNQLEAVAASAGVKFIKSAEKAYTRTGSIDSEGDTTHRAITSRAQFNVDGSGVKVGVLSDSVDFLAQSQATGDLPADLTVLPGQSGVPGSGEGTAMLEIVHDLAPGSKLYYATAFNGEASFAQNILNLRAAGCDVIVDDVFYFNESPFQDGIIAQAVDQVVNDGGLYFSAAGNEGNLNAGTSGTWQGDFLDGGAATSPVDGKGGNVHMFGTNPYNTVTRPGFAAVLFWSDPLGASTNDYDLYVVDAAGTTIVDASTTVQNGSQDPYEIAVPMAAGQRIVVVKASGDPRFLHLDTIRGRLSLGTTGNIKGHAVATNAFGVAAVDVNGIFPGSYSAINTVEPFSSDGPRRLFYHADGTPITPGNLLDGGGAVREKPVIAAADGVATTVPGFRPFYGTSAAAPHAAAIAALLKSYNPQLTVADMWFAITNTALDIQAPGWDINSGQGILMADLLLQGSPAGINLIISTNYMTGGNGNGTVDPNECNMLTIVLNNTGGVGLTNLEASISTTNTGVIITSKTSFYPDLPPGASGSNIVAFRFSTAPGFICGTPLQFAVSIKSDQAAITKSVSLRSGVPGAPVRFDSAGPVAIPDNSVVESPIVVSNFNSGLFKVTVALFITHTFDRDLRLSLISPDGVTNVLADRVGRDGNNFGISCADGSRAVFDDTATTPISVGAAPFVGNFRPTTPLSVYIGKTGASVNGTWRLRMEDLEALDSGTNHCWSLFLTPAVCTDGGGECPGSDLAIGGSSAPEPAVTGNDFTYTLNITNRGPKTATGVSLTQILPPNVLYQNATITKGTISGSQGSPNVSGNIGTLAAGEVVTASVTVKAIQLGTITSSATVAGVSDPDPDLANNSVNISSHINPPTADMAIGMVASANPVLMGGTLIYTISVTNNGPSAASGIIVSNTLPGAVSLVSASPSQGSTTIAGNIVIFNFGSLDIGAVATATVGVIPLAQGQITASARVSANQFDPISANSVATVNTSVSPAADLAVGIDNVPAAIVLGQNLTYIIRATNNGPSVASGVLISQEIPTNGTLITATSDAGVISMSENVVSCDLTGTNLPMNATVTMTVVVGFASTSTNHTSVSIVGALADPNPANNQVSATTIVAPPFVAIEPLSAVLSSESLPPPNGSVESGETVTVQLRVRNGGNIATTNLMARLLATGGVTSPTTATRLYGAIPPGGFSSAQPFTFTASGASGGMVTATLQLSGDATNTISFTFALQDGASFANTNLIVIYDGFSNTNVAASPYPSSIMVSGITGLVGRVTATLSNLNHAFPHDVSILLVAPSGASTLLMSHAADVSSASGVNITFDDLALQAVPEMGSISSGSWRPAAYGAEPVFPATVPPATNVPAGPYTASMSSFNGLNPNGVWSLFVMDDNAGDGGAISNGWSLAITTITPINTVADIAVSGSSLPNPVLLGGLVTNIFTIVNNGTNQATGVVFTNVLSPNLALVSTDVSVGGAIVSTGGGKVIANLASLDAGANATVTVVMSPTAAGVFYSTGIVAAVETDLSPANNLVAVATTVNVPVADVAIWSGGSPNPVVLGSNLVYTITVTNSGPQNALNVVVTDPLPSALTFLSSSIGTFASGTLTCNLGTLLPNQSAQITVRTRANALGTITNTATVGTSSSDPITGNNTSAVTTVIRAPAANVVAAGAKLISESFVPKDGTIAPGEIVTVSLTLTNRGEINTPNLTATLLSTGGVTSPGAPQNYGVIQPGGSAKTKDFTFTASPSSSGVITATLQLSGGLGNVSFVFALPQTVSDANTNAIIIPDHGAAAPYPSTINVSGRTGVVSKVVINLNGFTHSFPHDVGVLLVGPSGARAVVMSNVGGSRVVTNLNLTFSDAATTNLSEFGQLVSGTFLPTAILPSKVFPALGSVAAVPSAMTEFLGTNPNGTWSLYVVDDATGDAGRISAGWSLSITTVTPVAPVADVAISLVEAGPSPAYTGLEVNYSFLITNRGPAVATSVVVSNSFPGGSIAVSNIGTLNVGDTALVPFSFIPTLTGATTNWAFVTTDETDLHTVDNSASASLIVLNLTRPQLSGVIVSNQFRLTLTGQASMTYIIQASTNLVNWTSILTNTAAPNGTLQVPDTDSFNWQQRFYRAIAAP